MRLSKASYYGVQALGYIALKGEGNAVTSEAVASALGISDRFLLKVLQPLAQAGILASSKGPNGGYRLLKEPEKVTLREIISAVDGERSSYVPPVEANWTINKSIHKKLEAAYAQAVLQFRVELDQMSLADLTSARKTVKV